MPLVGHGALVADNPHCESKCDLLGPHRFASAENALLERGMQEDLSHDTGDFDIISTEHTSENGILPPTPGLPVSSHRSLYRSLLIHQRRHSFREQLNVSNTIVNHSAFVPPLRLPRLILLPDHQQQWI